LKRNLLEFNQSDWALALDLSPGSLPTFLVDQNTSLKSQAHAVFTTARQVSLLDASARVLAELLL
jgi:hypothetical protein